MLILSIFYFLVRYKLLINDEDRVISREYLRDQDKVTMQSEILERIRLNQQELSRLRLEEPIGLRSVPGIPAPTVIAPPSVSSGTNSKSEETDLYQKFSTLRNEYLKSGQKSSRVLNEFKKLENQVLQLEQDVITDDDDELVDLRKRHAKEMLLIKHQREMLLQKLEIQKIYQYLLLNLL